MKLNDTENIVRNKKIIAVSPIIGNQAVKGPAAKLFHDFGLEPSALGIARLYKDFIQTLVLDIKNKDEISNINDLGIKTYATDIIMIDRSSKIRLASEVINLTRNDSL